MVSKQNGRFPFPVTGLRRCSKIILFNCCAYLATCHCSYCCASILPLASTAAAAGSRVTERGSFHFPPVFQYVGLRMILKTFRAASFARCRVGTHQRGCTHYLNTAIHLHIILNPRTRASMANNTNGCCWARDMRWLAKSAVVILLSCNSATAFVSSGLRLGSAGTPAIHSRQRRCEYRAAPAGRDYLARLMLLVCIKFNVAISAVWCLYTAVGIILCGDSRSCFFIHLPLPKLLMYFEVLRM